MGSAAASWILTYDQVPQRFAEWVSTTLREPWLVILAMNLIMLAIGGPLDLAPAILLLAPIFVPLAQQIGLDPLQLGLIMVINLGIGLYTPPVGTTLFISSTIAGSTMGEIVTSVQRVTDIMAEISAASQEQSAGIEQVNHTVNQMDETTQQNAALVEEATAAARSMEEQAAQLVEAVASFRLSQDAGVAGLVRDRVTRIAAASAPRS